ncbi:MAG: hypothetical protein WD773_02660 [Gemmatimonadales bacterium]
MMKRFVASILLASMVACTTLRPVADYQQYVRTSQPSQLWITPRNAQPLLIEGPRFLNDTLVGFVSGRYQEFAPSDLGRVQVRQAATGRTVLLLSGVVAVSALLISLLATGGTPNLPPNPEQPPTSTHP